MKGRLETVRLGESSSYIALFQLENNEVGYSQMIKGNQKINHISAKLINEEFEFSADVSSDRIFVKDEKLPSNLKEIFPAELTFYDENNRVIHAADHM